MTSPWLLVPCLSSVVLMSGWFLVVQSRPNLPGFDEFQRLHATGSHQCLLARSGETVVCQRKATQEGWQAPWQALPALPPTLTELVIASEDRRFWAHAGADVRALVASVLRSPWHRRGGSTLSMQTARLILGRDALPSTLWGKLRQIDAAYALERQWSKAQILEAYLNLAPLRGNVRGFQTARALWLQGLTDDEQQKAMPLFVAMLPAPQATPQTLGRRSCAVLLSFAQMQRSTNTSRGEAYPANCNALQSADWQLWHRIWTQIFQSRQSLATTGLASVTAYGLTLIDSSATLRSTLDSSLQYVLAQHMHEGLRRLEDSDVKHAAGVLLDNATGQVLAYATASLQGLGVDMVSTRRTVASTLKPFLYALALDRKQLRPSERIVIRGRVFRQGSCDLRDYQPRDSVALYQSSVSPALGLAASSNVAAVDILTRITPNVFHGYLQSLGVLPVAAPSSGCTLKPRYGHALALGAASSSLLDLTNAYRSLANGGWYSPALFWLNESQSADRSKRVLSSNSSAWVSEALSNQKLRFEGFGPDNPLDTLYWSASKTGTSDGYRDNWALGYTRSHTLGIWVGNADGSPMRGVFGPSGAAPIWRAVMDSVQVR